MNSTNKGKMIYTEFAVAKTAVWWDIDGCPVPDGYDPRHVGPSIESTLEKYGYPGPYTIIASGNLQSTPRHVLEALSSTGIRFKHLPNGENGLTVFARHIKMGTYDHKRPPLDPLHPPTVMIISRHTDQDIEECLCFLQFIRFTILRAYPKFPKESYDVLPYSISRAWLWESLLKDSVSAKETRSPDTCTISPWFCAICYFATQTCAEFFKHIHGTSHVDCLAELRRLDSFKNKLRQQARLLNAKQQTYQKQSNAGYKRIDSCTGQASFPDVKQQTDQKQSNAGYKRIDSGKVQASFPDVKQMTDHKQSKTEFKRIDSGKGLASFPNVKQETDHKQSKARYKRISKQEMRARECLGEENMYWKKKSGVGTF